MATVLQQTSVYNVEATLNTHFTTELAAITFPAWIGSTPPLYSNWPDRQPVYPSLSINHIPVSYTDIWQGRVVDSAGTQSGLEGVQLMEVNCWVSRDNTSWLAQLRTLQDAVMTIIGRTKSVVIKDYAANAGSPSDTNYIVRLRGATPTATAPDPNPDIERRRVLIEYDWVYRSV